MLFGKMYEIRVYQKSKPEAVKVMTVEGLSRACRLASSASQMSTVACVIVQDVEGLEDPTVYEDGWEVD